MAAYAEPGADVICAPGRFELADIRTLIAAVAPKPVDIQLMKAGVRAEGLGELGVQHVSVGYSFRRSAQDEFRTRGPTIN
jgi:2-methylisocitrate lyase-like PEP mutase family enzyme